MWGSPLENYYLMWLTCSTGRSSKNLHPCNIVVLREKWTLTFDTYMETNRDKIQEHNLNSTNWPVLVISWLAWPVIVCLRCRVSPSFDSRYRTFHWPVSAPPYWDRNLDIKVKFLFKVLYIMVKFLFEVLYIMKVNFFYKILYNMKVKFLFKVLYIMIQVNLLKWGHNI